MEPELDDPWQEFARTILLDAAAMRGLSTARQLSDVLAEQGMVIAPRTLARRISRGSFDAGFFLMFLQALGVSQIAFEGQQLADVAMEKKLRPRKR
nr:DUF6471 domain-containing protein [uncultured Rhodoferax sp.]